MLRSLSLISRQSVLQILISLLILLGFSNAAENRGERLIEERKYGEARAFFENALKSDPNDANAHYRLAFIFIQRGFRDLDAAEDHIDEAIDLNEGVSRYHLIRGQILGIKAQEASPLTAGFIAPKVKGAFLRSVELDPDNLEARSALMMYYLMAPGFIGGSEEEALKQSQEVLKRDAFQGHLLLATYHQRRKDSTKTEKELLAAIAAAPEKEMGYLRLGQFYLNHKRPAEAIQQYSLVVSLAPTGASGYFGLAEALMAQEKIDAAIEKYHTALYHDKNHTGAIYGLGQAYEKKGMKKEAIETYQWYLTVDPSSRRAETVHKKLKEIG